MAIAWPLKDERVTSVSVGVSRPEQLPDNTGALKKLKFSREELQEIEKILQA